MGKYYGGREIKAYKEKESKANLGIGIWENSDGLKIYLRELKKTEIPSQEEQMELARRYQKYGDESAKDELIRANLRFVISVAKHYQNQGLSLADLIQEGNIGLMRAIGKFDAERGYHFITYAVWWIRQGISKAICDTGRTIRLPFDKFDKAKGFNLELTELMGEGYPKVKGIEKIAKRLGRDSHEIEKLLEFYKAYFCSLDMDVTDDEFSSVIGDFVEDKYSNTEEEAFYGLLKKDIDETLATLPVREADIIRLRFGLDGEYQTLEEIGRKYGLTKERIRQIENKTLKKLRHPTIAKKLKDYVYS